MSTTEGDKERFGRALLITALAGTLLALAAVIGPRLLFRGGGESPPSTVAAFSAAEGAAAGQSQLTLPTRPYSDSGGVTTTIAPATTTTAPATTTSTTTSTTSTSTTTTTPVSTSTVPPVVPPTDDGAVELQLAGVHSGAYGPARSGFFAGDRIGWHLRVTNTGEQYLWGVFVYLESYGPVACEAHRLEAGASTDCWAETVAVTGNNDAEAWVTAWTETRMVGDRTSHRVEAAAV